MVMVWRGLRSLVRVIQEVVMTQQFFVPADGETGHDAAGLVEESLIEEVSIDGMCGVY